jgi:putative DNA methylase
LQKGTISRSKATCPNCGSVLAAERIAAQLADQNGGADPILDVNGARVGGARLIAVVTRKPGISGRFYRPASDADYLAIKRAEEHLAEFAAEGFPDEKLQRVPVPFGVINVRVYGMDKWEKLFSSRQKLSLLVFFKNNKEISDRSRS